MKVYCRFLLEKINQKVDKLLEQRNIVISEEQKLNNLLKQFENFNLGEKPIIKLERKIRIQHFV